MLEAAGKKRQLKLFTGNSNPELAKEISAALECDIGRATVSRFEDGEVNVVVHDNVRGQDVYIIQSTCTPVNENLMELMLMVSTMRRASARRITAVIPYYGSRAFFGPRVPVDNLDGGTVGVDYFGKRDDLVNPVIVSPDAGGVYRAKKFREHLDKHYGVKAGLAMIIKQRHKPGEIERMDLGASVTGSDVIIVDDMIDTAGTLCKAANELQKYGASARVCVCVARHLLRARVLAHCAVRAGGSRRDQHHPTLQVVPANSKIHSLSVGQLLASTIQRIHDRKSVSSLFSRTEE
ncbi:hypothetical protein BASA81_003839 [Batrachochytrium salamandrivorans]|nr:hypothetical protein BASA81_003839 [Batrachochytrium salamandrivorans]